MLYNGKLNLAMYCTEVKLTISTWEGDNTILSLQAGRSLVGAWGGKLFDRASRLIAS